MHAILQEVGCMWPLNYLENTVREQPQDLKSDGFSTQHVSHQSEGVELNCKNAHENDHTMPFRNCC